jgi:hypothetical protein
MTSPREHQPAPTDASCPIRPLIGYAAPARATRRFAQGTASVTLRADRDELIRGTETTLYSYARTRTAASRWTITLHTAVPVDQVGAAVLFADADDHDIGPNLQAQSINVPGGRAFWIRDHATLVHLDHLLGAITVHAGDLDAARFFAARLVRQAMTAQLLEHDAIYAHTAALVRAEHGLLIAGPKGAGKTTTLLSTLRLAGGDFVTNDRLLLRRDPDGDGTVGYAWPMHLRATVSTLRAVPGMTRFLPAEQHQNSPAGQYPPSGKIAIEPGDLRTALPDTRILGEVRPTLMLWPYRSVRPHDRHRLTVGHPGRLVEAARARRAAGRPAALPCQVNVLSFLDQAWGESIPRCCRGLTHAATGTRVSHSRAPAAAMIN